MPSPSRFFYSLPSFHHHRHHHHHQLQLLPPCTRRISGCAASLSDAGSSSYNAGPRRGRDDHVFTAPPPAHGNLPNDHPHTPGPPGGIKDQPQQKYGGSNSIYAGELVRSQVPPPRNDYNLSKVGLHASLWQKEIKKRLGDCSSDPVDIHPSSTVQKTDGTLSDHWESFGKPGDNFHEEIIVKEESMMLEEFQRRKEHDRVQIANFVKQHLYARRRPIDGWKYIVNGFGVSKGAKSSAFQIDESRASELEKLALKREMKPRRRTQ